MNPARPSFICASCARALRQQPKSQVLRPFSSTSTLNAAAPSSQTEPQEEFPRWKQTVPAMKMPHRTRIAPRQEWRVNTDEERLNAAYDRFFGRAGGENAKGRDLLDEETKWIAITHKSHEQGKQGSNDRLAFLGKRILDLQTSLLLLSSPSAPIPSPPKNHVYRHPALEGIENITPFTKLAVLDKSRLAGLANSYGLDRVVRWRPRKIDNMQSSGVEVVLSHLIYSIVGAVALKQGGEVAARVARERVLAPLGLR